MSIHYARLPTIPRRNYTIEEWVHVASVPIPCSPRQILRPLTLIPNVSVQCVHDADWAKSAWTEFFSQRYFKVYIARRWKEGLETRIILNPNRPRISLEYDHNHNLLLRYDNFPVERLIQVGPCKFEGYTSDSYRRKGIQRLWMIYKLYHGFST